MLSSIRNRLIVIGLLVAASIFTLIPRTITVRVRGDDGIMHDKEEKKVPLKYGLDLQGGMHLALELDQSKQVSTDPKRDIDLALTVLRKRIDEFGVTEPLIQKSGNDRIVVELAGISDPARAKAVVQRSAFLEFRITDKTGALDKVLPAMDRTLRSLGVQGGAAQAKTPTAVQKLLGDSGARKDSAADTGPAILAGLIQPASGPNLGGMPGEYMVPEAAYPRVDSMLNIPDVQKLLPRNLSLRWASAPTSVGVDSYRLLYALDEKPIVTGTSLVDASAQLDPLTQGAIVVFELDRAGGRRFGAETGRHVGDYMAILLDD